MIVMTALILGWGWFTEYMYKKHPEWRRPGETVAVDPATTRPAVTQPPASVNPAIESSPTTVAPSPATTASSTKANYRIVGGEGRQITIGSDARSKDNAVKMAVTLSATGAGVEQVVLNEFDAADQYGKPPEQRQHYTYQQPFNGFEAVSRPLATRAITINGQRIDLASAKWKLASSDDSSARFTLDVLDGEMPVARLHKTFALSSGSDAGLGYEVGVDQRIENLSGSALSVSAELNGPIPPVREILSNEDRQILAAHVVDGRLVVEPHYPHSFTEKVPSIDLTQDAKGNRFAWFGASSVYFNAIVRPNDPSQIADVKAAGLILTTPADQRMVTLDFRTVDLNIAPGASESVGMNVFFGPKQREVLNNEYYTSLGYNHTLGTLNSGCANWCTHPFIINSLVWLLGAFHFIFRDWGIAIICLVIVVRTLLHPITKRSTISMHKMGKMGPEMERLKKKYGDNKEELNAAMMQMYKQQGATPILGCLPMFLQMPIWIALWSALQNTFQLRQAGFLHFGNFALTWIDDLSKPDALFSWTPFPLMFGFKLGALNVLPILMGVVFYLQQKFTPKPAAATPEQAQQQKMMLWMTVLLFPLFLYNGPSGLNLYILTSTTIGIIEMRRIRAHIQEREEREKLEGPIKVEVAPSRMGRKLAKERGPAEPEKKGLAKWLADLQQKAEEMKKNSK